LAIWGNNPSTFLFDCFVLFISMKKKPVFYFEGKKNWEF